MRVLNRASPLDQESGWRRRCTGRSDGSPVPDGVFCAGKLVKYAFIEKHQGVFTISLMCGVIEVLRSACHDWLRQPKSLCSRKRGTREEARKVHKRRRETDGQDEFSVRLLMKEKQ
ncbi:MAG: hypothetical protein COB33_013575 [Thiotrichaceae bacterium]|nr:hypothetical protein [Thiotrichaceae bacterium]